MSQSGMPSTRMPSTSPKKRAPSQTPSLKTQSSRNSFHDSAIGGMSGKTSPTSPTEAMKEMKLASSGIFQSGQKQLNSGVIHVYTVKATDLRTGNPLEDHKALLRKHIIDKLGTTVEKTDIGKMTFLANKEWFIKVKGSQSEPVDKVVLVELLESTDDRSCLEIKCLTDVNKVITLSDFEKRGSGHKARWVKFVALDVHESAGDDLQQLRKVCEWNMVGDGHVNGLHRCFALTFAHDRFDLADLKEPVRLPAQIVLDSFAASELKRHIVEVSGQDTLEPRGAYVISSPEKIESGIEYRSTLEASLVLTKDGVAPTLVWKSRKATAFLQETTVADVLIDHFGRQSSCGLDDHQLSMASKIFKGVRVCVAVAAADRPRIATIYSLEGSARWNPESMFGTVAGTSSIDRLRYPDLPCVNVGSSKKSFFFPAELCKIQPNQSYSGPLPLRLEATSFNTAAPVLKVHNPKSPGSNPFSDVGETDFTFTFARLVGPGGSSVSVAAWKDFQYQLGERFDGKLRTSVSGAKQFTGDLQQLRDHLTHKDYRGIGVKTVLLIVAPASIPTSELDAFKTFCDTKIGAQVQVVAAAEVNRRYNRDAENRGMVMYTGQVVRNIFARALIPGRPDLDGALLNAFNYSAKRITSSGIFGVNIRPFSTPDCVCESKKSFVISVVSAVGDQIKTVPTTTTLLTVGASDGPEALDSGISAAFETHLKNDKPAQLLKTAVAYMSGLPALDRFQIIRLASKFRDSISKSLKNDGTTAGKLGFTLIAMTPETRVSVPPAPEPSPTPKDESQEYLPLSPGEVPGIDNHSQVGHLVLAQVYRKPAGYHKADGALKPGSKLWHTLRRKILTDGQWKTEELLNKAREPSILQLAVKANKRCMGRVVKAAGKYKIVEVEESLKGTLWYL